MKKTEKTKTTKKKREDVKLQSLHFPDGKGGMTAVLSHSAIPAMAEHFIKLFKESGGVNYVEWTMEDKKHPEFGQFSIIIQRKDGLTPSEKATKYRGALEHMRDHWFRHLGAGETCDTLDFINARLRD